MSGQRIERLLERRVPARGASPGRPRPHDESARPRRRLHGRSCPRAARTVAASPAGSGVGSIGVGSGRHCACPPAAARTPASSSFRSATGVNAADRLVEVGRVRTPGRDRRVRWLRILRAARRRREVKVDTPYGAPSDSSSSPRSPAERSPSCRATAAATDPAAQDQLRANVWAMSSLGVKAVISPCAAGSLQLDVKPGEFVICDQFVDRTRGRNDTFYDGPIVTHCRRPSLDPVMRQLASETIRDHGIAPHEPDTVVVIQGPRFSTRSESKWFASRAGRSSHDPVPRGIPVPRARDTLVNIALIADYDAGVPRGPRRWSATAWRGLRRTRSRSRGGLDLNSTSRPFFDAHAHRQHSATVATAHDLSEDVPPVRDGAVGGGAWRARPDRLPIGVTHPDDPGRAAAGGSRARGASTRPATRASGAGTTSWASGDLTVPVVEGWTDRCRWPPARRSRIDASARSSLNVMNRHPAVARPDGRPRSRSRAAAGSSSGIGIGGAPEGARGVRHRRSRDAARARRAASRRPSRSSGRCGPAGRSRGESPFYPLVEAHARTRCPDPPPRIIIGGETRGRGAAGRPDRRRLDARSTTTSRRTCRSYLEALEAAGRRRADQLVLVGFQGDWLGDADLAESEWIREPAAARERWAAAGADGAIVLARTTADVDALVAAAERR